MRRLLAIFAIASLLLLTVSAPAFAGRRWTAPAPSAPVSDRSVQHGNQACMDSDPVSGLQSGITSSSPNYGRTAVGAYISFRVDPCSTSVGSDDDSLGAAWIGLVPRIAADASQIVQMGIMDCYEGAALPSGLCQDFPGQIRYFYAYGGCTYVNGPYPRDAGAADLNLHQYRLERTAGYFVLYFPNGRIVYIDRGNIAVSCYAAGNLKAQWAGEKLDRGDSLGSVSAHTYFVTEGWKSTQDNDWHSENWNGPACQFNMATAPHNTVCQADSNFMDIWD